MKKNARRLLAALMCATVVLSMSACTTGSETDDAASSDGAEASKETKDIKDIVVGLSIGNTTEERWNREIEMFQEYAELLNLHCLHTMQKHFQI